jgi:hypothetical protein
MRAGTRRRQFDGLVRALVLTAGILTGKTSDAGAASNEAPSSTLSSGLTFDGKTYTNRLIRSQDPYLLLHAHNPVDWYPWGPEALAAAKRENKPIFVSIGYSTCYWCHVAEREIYSDPKIAKLMNEWFINIKVDREERPDIDRLHGGEIGLDYVRPGLRTQFTFYRTQISNMITVATIANPPAQLQGFFVQQDVNAASVQAQGFEAEANWDIGSGFSTILNYTYADSVYKDNPVFPTSVGYQLQDVPKDTAAAGVTYKDKRGWRVAMQTRWVSRTNWVNPDHSAPAAPAQASADSNFIVDLSAAYPVLSNVEAYVQTQNLFNRRYIANPGAFGPLMEGAPFQAYGGVRITLR